MLSLAEYQAYSNDIQTLGEQTDQQIDEATTDSPNKQDAIKKAKSLIGPYQYQLKRTLDQALLEIGLNTLHHYSSATHLELDEKIVAEAIKDQYRKRYYGSTLNQRLVLMKLRLNRIITQTAQVGTQHLAGTFSNSFPFGAQTNISKRLLQGSAIKLEQDIARGVAKEVDYPLVKWTLAKQHLHPCRCEAYASYIDSKVKSYIATNNLDIDPEGVFFIDDLPDPPHPNCQCEFDLIDDKGREEIVPSHGRRILSRLHRLVRKLLGT